jgi:hypothetical protein
MIGGSSPGRDWEFFSSPPCPGRLRGLPSLLSMGIGDSFPGGKAAGVWSCLLTSEVKNAWSYTPTPQYTFRVWCSVKKKDRGNFTFTCLATIWSPGIIYNSVLLPGYNSSSGCYRRVIQHVSPNGLTSEKGFKTKRHTSITAANLC